MYSEIIKKIKSFFCKPKYDKKLVASMNLIPRHWGILPVLDRYILREFLTKFFILLLVFIFGFIMGDIFDSLVDFLDVNASIKDIVLYFSLRLPGNVRFVLPITMLLGCIWTMAAFGKNLEITAMRASGVSLFRCGGPILLIGLLVSCINIYFNEYLVPYSEKAAEIIKCRVDGEDATTAKMLVFRSSDGQRAWFFRVFDSKALHENVILKYYRDNGTLEYELNAENARYIAGKGWVFTNVVKTKYNDMGLLPYTPEKFPVLSFSEKEIIENPNDIFNAIKDEETLPSWVILDILNRSENMSQRMRNVYWTLFYYRMAFPWACLLAVFLGIPMATKGERSGIMLAIISAVGVIIGFMIVANIGLMLGKKGVVPPIIAGIGPTFCFILYGYYKVRNSQC